MNIRDGRTVEGTVVRAQNVDSKIASKVIVFIIVNFMVLNDKIIFDNGYENNAFNFVRNAKIATLNLPVNVSFRERMAGLRVVDVVLEKNMVRNVFQSKRANVVVINILVL